MAFCRVMRYYSSGYRETLNLPIRTFWFMNQCVNRLEAESNLRNLEVAASAGSKEGYTAMRDGLIEEMGNLMIKGDQLDLDRVGLDQLRGM